MPHAAWGIANRVLGIMEAASKHLFSFAWDERISYSLAALKYCLNMLKKQIFPITWQKAGTAIVRMI